MPLCHQRCPTALSGVGVLLCNLIYQHQRPAHKTRRDTDCLGGPSSSPCWKQRKEIKQSRYGLKEASTNTTGPLPTRRAVSTWTDKTERQKSSVKDILSFCKVIERDPELLEQRARPGPFSPKTIINKEERSLGCKQITRLAAMRVSGVISLKR